ncbi:50S ribosomal protein L28 [Patescibacteria group bacterium]|nr:50S ribosomal protein L28 [Patescibacteria group bacterium]
MYVCDHCGKGSQVGMNVSHSHVRTKKRSRPNLHKTTLVYDGRRQTMKLCTKCLRVAKKQSVMGYKGETKNKFVVQSSSQTQFEKVETIKKESHTLSEDIMKAATSTKKEPAKASKS